MTIGYITITKIYAGQQVPQEVEVRFSLANHDWLKLQKKPFWNRLEAYIANPQKERIRLKKGEWKR